MEIRIGLEVTHNRYGSGKVRKITDDNCYVLFACGQRIFPIPKAFYKGFLLCPELTDSPKEHIIDMDENKVYERTYEVINDTIGLTYNGWQKGTWPSDFTKLPFRLWFVHLSEANDYKNQFEKEGTEFVYENKKSGSSSSNMRSYAGTSLIFAKANDNSGYMFQGAFEEDFEKTENQRHVFKRVATKVKLIGSPASGFEILDNRE